MNQYLRNLTAEQQVSALFIIVFGLLFLTHVTVFMLSLRERGDTPQAEVVNARLAEARALLRTSWAMVIVFWVGWASGEGVATTLFAIVAFFALREFITLSPTRRGDHRSLVLAFFVVLPIQFWLVATAHFDLFTVFIPVYVFLAIPVVSALADDPQRFLERNAKLQWGIMVCVYGVSHVPALLLLQFPKWGNKGAFLVFFLVFVVQTGTLVQHLVSRRWPRHHGHPTSARASTGPAGPSAWPRAACWVGCCPASRPSSRAGHGHGPDRLRGGFDGAPGDEGAQARPRRAELGRTGSFGHRRQRPAGPGGCAVFCRAGVFSLGSMVFWGIAQRRMVIVCYEY
jgi:phosphatidate cytidylyltransferase